MQDVLTAWQTAMGQWPIGLAVRNVVWVKALLESAHIAAMGLVLYAVGMICLRLAGLASRGGSLTEMVRRFSPWVWGALVIVFVTGLILITGANERRGLPTPMFQLKMVLMVLSILVTAALQFSLQSNAAFWELSPARRISAKVIAPLCLFLWMFTVCAGRWLAYGYVIFPERLRSSAMDIVKTIGALDQTALATWVQAEPLAFPGLEAAHVISVMLVFGSIVMLDLRLLGASSRNHGVIKISEEVLPWTWVSFLIAVVSGTLLFVGQATHYLNNNEFKLKMIMLALAGVNLAVFHFFTWNRVQSWNDGVPTPPGAKVAAVLSLSLWSGVVIAGRWIGWTLVGF